MECWWASSTKYQPVATSLGITAKYQSGGGPYNYQSGGTPYNYQTSGGPYNY
jgi:hypothetical protein